MCPERCLPNAEVTGNQLGLEVNLAFLTKGCVLSRLLLLKMLDRLRCTGHCVGREILLLNADWKYKLIVF